VSSRVASCGQSVHVAAHEPSCCTDSRTEVHARSVQSPAGHEAAVHDNSNSMDSARTRGANATVHSNSKSGDKPPMGTDAQMA